MPSNPYKDQQRAFSHLRRLFGQVPNSGVNKKLLICETLASYPVSKASVTDYINSHIEAGVLREEEGVLYAK